VLNWRVVDSVEIHFQNPFGGGPCRPRLISRSTGLRRAEFFSGPAYKNKRIRRRGEGTRLYRSLRPQCDYSIRLVLAWVLPLALCRSRLSPDQRMNSLHIWDGHVVFLPVQKNAFLCNGVLSPHPTTRSMSFSGKLNCSVGMSTRALAMPGCDLAHSRNP
jgi:hypothetical protein